VRSGAATGRRGSLGEPPRKNPNPQPMMMQLRLGIAFAALASLAFAPLASTAAETASVSGYAYVCTADGPLPFARVSLTSRFEERSVRADENGRFAALGLTPGLYTISLQDVDLTVAPAGTEARWDLRRRAKMSAHASVRASRTVNLVANDNVTMRIGVGASMSPTRQIANVQCDPEVVPIKLSPIDRTTVVTK